MRRWQIVVGMILLLSFPAGLGAQSAEPNRVGLVVQYGDGTVATHCVEFGQPSISGHDALELAGLTLSAEYSALGAAVCKIEDDGCVFPADICFCQCNGSPCFYWAYHHLIDGVWQYSGFGASTYQLHPGDVDAWAWGEGSMSFGAQPPVFAFDEICPPVSLVLAAGSDEIEPPAGPIDVAALTVEGGTAATEDDATWPLEYAGLGVLVLGLAGCLIVANRRAKQE